MADSLLAVGSWVYWVALVLVGVGVTWMVAYLLYVATGVDRG